MSVSLRRLFAGNRDFARHAHRARPGLWLLLLLIAACGTDPLVPKTMTLDLATVAFTALGQTQQLTASVTDQNGDPLTDVEVSWGSSNLDVATVTPEGVVTAQGAGTAQVTASAGEAGAETQVSVVQTPTQIQKVSGDEQTGVVGEALAEPLTVQVSDALGHPVSGVTVTFTVSKGGGAVAVETQQTGSEGQASTSFTTGTVAATPQAVTATVPSVSISVSFSAAAVAGPAASVEIAGGDNQQSAPGTALAVRPAVSIRDQYRNPVSGVSVTFEVIQGGGSVSEGSAVSDQGGVAQVGSWILGSAGTNRLRATAAPPDLTGNPVIFTALAQTGAFDIVLRFVGSPTSSQRQAFNQARDRWEHAINNDLADLHLTAPAGTCAASPEIDETIDDVLILVMLQAIDGPGNVIGSAGPCYIRNSNNLPVMGGMIFDTADLEDMEDAGLLPTVILHEMGHVLGIGSLWAFQGLLADPALGGGSDPHFTGAQAIAAFDGIGGTAYNGGAKVPVENMGGEGTADGHWRASVFGNELMTGFIESEVKPLSTVSIASLADQGYSVNLGEADPYALSLSLRAASGARRLALGNDLLRAEIKRVDSSGRVVGLFRR